MEATNGVSTSPPQSPRKTSVFSKEMDKIASQVDELEMRRQDLDKERNSLTNPFNPQNPDHISFRTRWLQFTRDQKSAEEAYLGPYYRRLDREKSSIEHKLEFELQAAQARWENEGDHLEIMAKEHFRLNSPSSEEMMSAVISNRRMANEVIIKTHLDAHASRKTSTYALSAFCVTALGVILYASSSLITRQFRQI